VTEPIKFLIVDDAPENLVAMEGLLRRDNLELLLARSGSEALELLLKHDVALALLDIQMPVMDGFELAELMRGSARTRSVPIIFVTAGARDPLRVFQGYEAGAVDFMFKPIDPHILKSKADVFFELARQQKELAASLRLNEMFVGILGHDLRNPLGAMVTGAELLAARHADDKLSVRTTQRMLASGQRMTSMIEQLLDLTRARLAGGLGFMRARKRVDVAELVQRAVDELRPSHPARVIDVQLHGDSRSSGDPDRLLQLLSNLIANALQHGTPATPVRVALAGDDDAITVRIHNEGVIPPEVLPVMFDPFRGRTGGAHGAHGLGLGLFISREIARAHGGEISVESTEASGTAFAVALPRRAVGDRSSLPGACTILIVDDDQDTCDSLRDAFEDLGYVVATASNGRDALDQLRQRDRAPAVVILDLVMPVLDGWCVFDAMQDDPALSRIPVIVSTSNPHSAPPGAVVMAKPVKLDRLLELVGNLLQSGPGAPNERTRSR
jgi:two-component system sensor histidine kinase/response regulator